MEDYLKEAGALAVAYVPKVVGAIAVLIIGFWLASILAGFVRKQLERRGADPSLTPFLTSVTLILFKVLVLLSAASMFGFEVTSFVAIFGALALAIGMALQGNLSHMAAGVLILFFRPLSCGRFYCYAGVFRNSKRDTDIYHDTDYAG